MIWLVVISSIIALGVVIGLVIHFKKLVDRDSSMDSGIYGWIMGIIGAIAVILWRLYRGGFL